MYGFTEIALLIIICVTVVRLWQRCRPDKRMEFFGNQIPGPRPWPLVGNALSMAKNGRDELDFQKRMTDKYGHIHRHWIGNLLYVALSDPKDVEVILKHPKEIKKSIWYSFTKPWLGTGILGSWGDKWTQRRKLLTPGFHFQILEQFMEVFNRKASLLSRNLLSDVNGVVDMMDHVTKTTVHTICETAMGVQTDYITDDVSTYLRSVRNISELIADRISKPILHPDFMWRLSGKKRQEDKEAKILETISNKVIKEKEESILSEGPGEKFLEITGQGSLRLKKKMAFLEMMLRMKLDGNPVFQTNDDVREETATIFFAGHDTVSTAVCFTLESLARHTSIQDELHYELKANIEDIDQIKASELQNMPFLDRVLKESLRLYPSAPLISRELINDLELPSGYTIPAGSMVAIVIYQVHRHPEHYENPEEFNPDNFLPERVAQRHPFAFIPFSAGPRNCIGQKFAMLEFKTIISKILYNFRVELPGGVDDRPLTPYEDIVLRAVEGHTFALRQRQH